MQEARELFASASADPVDAANALHNLGVIALAEGDLAQGQALLLRAVELADDMIDLDVLLLVDLADLERTYADAPDDDPIRTIFADIHAKVDAKRRVMSARRAPLDELTQIVRRLEQEGETGSVAWTGAQAGRARMWVEKEAWDEASEIYRQLLRAVPDRFPEATVGLKQCLEGIRNAGDEQVHAGDLEAALRLYEESLALAREAVPDDRVQQAELHGRLAYARFALDDHAGARGDLAAALRLRHEHGDAEAATTVGAVLQSLLPDTARYRALRAGLQAWAAEADGQLRDDLALVLAAIAKYPRPKRL